MTSLCLSFLKWDNTSIYLRVVRITCIKLEYLSGMYINKGYINVNYSFLYIIVVVSLSAQSNLQFYVVFFTTKFSNV